MSGRQSSCLVLLVLMLSAAFLGCTRRAAVSAVEGPVWFEDITESVGLDFVHDAGPVDGRYFMPQIMGSGAALFDFDNDGKLDILLLNNGGPKGRPNQLFKQMDDGTFQNVSAGSGLDYSGYCMGVAIGDVNNDGLPDVLITEYSGLRLFLNSGGGKFTDVTRESGLDNPLWGTSAAFVDYDRDGWLDLVVVNYLDYDPSFRCSGKGKQSFCHPDNFPGTVTKLFRNLGKKGRGNARVRFEDRTLPSGLGRTPGPGLGIACADFNGDGWPDILVANDARPNHLWINQKDGTFKEAAVLCGLAYNIAGKAEGNMGIGLADVNGDGLLDVFITHLTDEMHTLWLQGPRGAYRDQTATSGLTRPHWRGTGFGTVLADFDHDGAPDLVVVNGRVREGPSQNESALGPFWSAYAERNQVFANDGTGKFTDISQANDPFCGAAGVSRGLSMGDIDGDGALDLLVATVAGRARLYRNVAPNRGHWLYLRALLDKQFGSRDALGAEITIEVAGKRQLAVLCPAQSYLSSHAPAVHFGLGQAERVEAIHVAWPDGTCERFPGCQADKRLVLRQGEGMKDGQ